MCTKFEDEPDEIDLKLLRMLIKNGRATNKEMARNINLSEPATKQRVEKLIKRGYIKGFTAKIDHSRLGYNLAFHTMASVKSGGHSIEVAEKLMELPEISSVDSVTGMYDLIIKGKVKDQEHLYRTLKKIQETEYISHLLTMMVIKSMGEKEAFDFTT
ncbi:Lrp/AsnC family transcriptional regulator [Oxyplasma meridianum]|uniref:Lrp/AsnC family transcriptional regulator n=1 Tax=Oxyplasma meridianum TaxID=3073602 RepID=A0AAX4NHL1_9ARCH